MSPRPTLIACGLLLFAGCGWNTGLTLPDDLPEGATVGVEFFILREDIPVRDLEPLLQSQLTEVVSDLVHARLASPKNADYVIRGRILEYRRRGGIRNRANQLLESGVRIVASAELVERASGKTVRPSTTVGIWSGYTAGPELAIDNERAARDRALRQIAETLVLDLFGDPAAGDASGKAKPRPESASGSNAPPRAASEAAAAPEGEGSAAAPPSGPRSEVRAPF